MKYIAAVIASLFLVTVLGACGMGGKKSSSGGGMMMKCGMKMGAMEHGDKSMKHDETQIKDAKSETKCGSDMKMDGKDYSEKEVVVH